MNSIAEINRINQRELELGITTGSWHDEYKDSAYIFIGGLDFGLTEGDVITVFSQFGEIADVNLPRDKTTGKTRGFGFVMYENQKSTVLAVDNMNGAEVVGRIIRVDHCRSYQQPKEKNAEGEWVLPDEPKYNALVEAVEESASESSASEADDIDDEDPMAAYLREQKRSAKGKGKAKKHPGETKEERKKRRAEKKAKKDMKRLTKGIKKEKATKEIQGGRKDREHSEKRDHDRSSRRDRDRDASPERERSEKRDHDRSSRRDRDREASPDRPRHRERSSGRADGREDYRAEREHEYRRERDEREKR